MKGKIESGQLCTVEPLGEEEKLKSGDIVLCKVRGMDYLHLVKRVSGDRYEIGNNKGKINGWITIDNVFGKLVSVED